MSYNLLCWVASAFGEDLARKYLDQTRSSRRRGDLSGENLLWGHAPTVIFGIRVISCANDRPFKGDSGKQTLAPTVSVDCGYGRDCSLCVPTYGPCVSDHGVNSFKINGLIS